MDAGFQLMLWGIAIIAVVLVNYPNRNRDPDALGVAMMLLMIWCLSRVLSLVLSPPAAWAFFPVVDLVAAATSMAAWVTRKAAWKMGVTLMFGIQLCAHAAFWLSPRDAVASVAYLTTINSALVVQLLLVATPGVRHGAGVLGSRLGPRVPRRIRAHPHAGS